MGLVTKTDTGKEEFLIMEASKLQLGDLDRDGLILLIQRLDEELLNTREKLRIAYFKIDSIHSLIDSSDEEIKEDFAESYDEYVLKESTKTDSM